MDNNDFEAEVIKAMVNQFLNWKLPEDFSPDAGISYKKLYPDDYPLPTGTNLFSATQAEAMVRYMLKGEAKAQLNKLLTEARIDELMDIPRKAEVRRKNSNVTNVKDRIEELKKQLKTEHDYEDNR